MILRNGLNQLSKLGPVQFDAQRSTYSATLGTQQVIVSILNPGDMTEEIGTIRLVNLADGMGLGVSLEHLSIACRIARSRFAEAGR